MVRSRRTTRPPLGWTIRRADQAVVATLVAAGLVATALYWVRHADERHRLIEVDRAPRAPAAYVVDINQADWPELTQIPGIGEVLAKRIVEHRNEHGAFGDLHDVADVRGIGPRTLERIRPYLLPVAGREMVAGP